MTEIIWQDATGQAEAITSGEVSAVELVEAYLARIDELDDQVRAYVSVDGDRARDAARNVDRSATFAGVALSIKDVEDVVGLPTTHSCGLLADHVAESDGPVVRRFREGGFALLGKTNVPEFCTDMTTSRLNGIARNPFDLDRTPGGSSGGAAAALAAGMCAIAHGTDGAGSVRGPAAFCGLVGLKPSRGLVTFGPTEGPAYFGTTVPGILSRSVRDAAAALDVLAPNGTWTPRRDRPFRDAVDGDPEPLRIAISTTAPMGVVEPGCVTATDDVGRLLESLGHDVDKATPPWDVILAASLGPMEVPGAAALVALDALGELEPRNRPLVEGLAQLTVLDHYRWVETVRAASANFLEFWRSYDVLVTPTMGMVAPPVEWAKWDDEPVAHMTRFMSFPSFAQPFNVSGQPAISLPLGWSSDGLPIGIQLAGRPLEESLLLRLGAQLEQAAPWMDRTVAAGQALTRPRRAP
jgi:amidase